jgi:hypothetical protein
MSLQEEEDITKEVSIWWNECRNDSVDQQGRQRDLEKSSIGEILTQVLRDRGSRKPAVT